MQGLHHYQNGAERRYQEHLRNARNVTEHTQLCDKKINQYGPANCCLIVLHRGVSWACACELERFYIAEWGTYVGKEGYNKTTGGEGGALDLPPESEARQKAALLRGHETQRRNGHPELAKGREILRQKRTAAR